MTNTATSFEHQDEVGDRSSNGHCILAAHEAQCGNAFGETRQVLRAGFQSFLRTATGCPSPLHSHSPAVGTMASINRTHELHSLSSLIKTLTNAQLKDILRSEGLTVSGVKTALQLRIIECPSPFRLWLGVIGGADRSRVQISKDFGKQGLRRLLTA